MKHGDVGLVIDEPVAADSPTGLGSARTSLALSVGFAIAYAVAVLVGRTTRLEGSQLALVWPAAAVGFLWLAVSWGNRRHVVADAVTLTILAAAINGLTGAGPLLSVLFGLSNSVQAVMTCAVLFRLRPRALRLRDPADLTALVYGSVVGGAASGLDAAHRNAAEQAALFETVISSISDGITVADSDGAILVHNPAARTLLGRDLPLERLDAWPDDHERLRPDGAPFPQAELPLVRALAGESITGVDLVVRNNANPQGRTLCVSAHPLAGPLGQHRAVAAFHDLSNQRRTEAELGMQAATSCSRKSPTGWSAACAPGTRLRGSEVTSSRSCAPTWISSTSSGRLRTGCSSHCAYPSTCRLAATL